MGYKRLDVNNIFTVDNSSQGGLNLAHESPAANLLFPNMNKNNLRNKKGISGQAFGVGEFEDEEDIDVYKQDTIEAYDFELDNQRHKDAKKLLNKTYGFGAFEDDVLILSNFKLSEKSKSQLKYSLRQKYQQVSTYSINFQTKIILAKKRRTIQ